MLNALGFNEIDFSAPLLKVYNHITLDSTLATIMLKPQNSISQSQEKVNEVKRNPRKVPLFKMAKGKFRGKRKLAIRDQLHKLFLHCYLKSGFQSIFKYFRKDSQHISENTVANTACILFLKYGIYIQKKIGKLHIKLLIAIFGQ